MTIASLITAAALLSATTLFGPPHITVRPITSTTAAVTFELDVEHHTTPEDLTVAGRAEGVRDGRRVSVPLTITRKSLGHFAVARQWDAGVPWVLVFSAEQGPNGSHGVVEGIVLLEANGTVKSIEYTKPGFHESTKKPLRLTSAKIDAALKTLGTTASPTR
jgi:hypothetical protein